MLNKRAFAPPSPPSGTPHRCILRGGRRESCIKQPVASMRTRRRLQDPGNMAHCVVGAMKEEFKQEVDALKEISGVVETTDRNKMAALLSVIPGLGHLYKRHYTAGLTILIAGNALMVLAIFWLILPTLGLALILLPAAWWAGIAASAYYAKDLHPQHPARTPELKGGEAD
jgi:hypothetical protein